MDCALVVLPRNKSKEFSCLLCSNIIQHLLSSVAPAKEAAEDNKDNTKANIMDQPDQDKSLAMPGCKDEIYDENVLLPPPEDKSMEPEQAPGSNATDVDKDLA
ncbi:hypothetical protein ACA910_017615 [Epithemia clementina (nom. ined.)]